MANRRYLFFAQRADIEGYNGTAPSLSVSPHPNHPSHLLPCELARRPGEYAPTFLPSPLFPLPPSLSRATFTIMALT